jgi:hypothetical protein
MKNRLSHYLHHQALVIYILLFVAANILLSCGLISQSVFISATFLGFVFLVSVEVYLLLRNTGSND